MKNIKNWRDQILPTVLKKPTNFNDADINSLFQLCINFSSFVYWKTALYLMGKNSFMYSFSFFIASKLKFIVSKFIDKAPSFQVEITILNVRPINDVVLN